MTTLSYPTKPESMAAPKVSQTSVAEGWAAVVRVGAAEARDAGIIRQVALNPKP